jgi:hypothetical protein
MPVPTVTSGSFAGADVYRNLLHKRVSIRSHGKVVAHADAVVVTGVTFRVQAAGVRRIRNQGQREVVAYVRGDVSVLPGPAFRLPEGAVRVCFNPFLHDAFVLEDGTPVQAADAFYMTAPTGSWALNPR